MAVVQIRLQARLSRVGAMRTVTPKSGWELDTTKNTTFECQIKVLMSHCLYSKEGSRGLLSAVIGIAQVCTNTGAGA